MGNVDLANPAELRGWMSQTVQFAVLSNGDEVDEDDLAREVNDCIVPKLPKDCGIIDLAWVTIERANELLKSDEECPIGSGSSAEQHLSVRNWMVKTVAVVHLAKQTPFTNEHLEWVADERIIKRIQGNRRRAPNRCDLDALVRRTLEYARGELAAHMGQ